MVAILLAVALALVHLFAGKLRFLSVEPRSRWLSFASGISVAYVFAHLLPEVAEAQAVFVEAGVERAVVGEGHVWLLALAGLVGFYGLARQAKASREEVTGEGDRTERAVFWVQMASYAVYNVLIGYLLGRGEAGDGSVLWLFWIAMALHFFVNDYGLRTDHKDRYTHTGRWVLAAAVVAGSGLGRAVELPSPVVAGLVALLAGGVVLNVLKEELPEERESRFWPFALGAASYAALLVAVGVPG